MWLSSHQPWPAGMGQALPAQQPTEAWLLCHPRVGNQRRSSWSLRFPCQLHSLLIGGTVILSFFPLEPCVHEPRVALKLGCSCVHFQEKKAPVCHRGLNGELRCYTVTSEIWLICRRIFTDNCNWRVIGSKMTCHPQLDKRMLLRETGRSSEHRGGGKEPCSHRCRQPRWPLDTEKGTKEMPHDKALSFQTICCFIYLSCISLYLFSVSLCACISPLVLCMYVKVHV